MLVATLGLSINAGAQEVQKITFDEVVRLAMERSTTLRTSENQLEVEASRVMSAKGNFLPDLVFSANPSANFGFNFDQTTLQLVNETTYNGNYGVNTSMNLFRGFGDVASLKQARSIYDVADKTYYRTEQDVLQQTILNYLQVIQDAETVKIQAENVTAQEQLLARIQEYTNVGTRPVSDLYQQQANTAQAELTLLNAERSVQLSEARLIGQLLLDPLKDYDFVAPTSDQLDLSPRSYNPVELIKNAFDQRFDLQAQRSRIEAADQGVKATLASYWPSVNLSAAYGTSYSSADPLDRPFSEQAKENRSGNIRLGFVVPLFNRFDTKFRVQQARVNQRNTQIDLESLEQRVALEVRQSYLDYQTALKQLDVTERQLVAAEKALEAEQERYNVGASTLVELTQSQASYVSASSGRVQALVNYVARVALINYYVGSISAEDSIF